MKKLVLITLVVMMALTCTLAFPAAALADGSTVSCQEEAKAAQLSAMVNAANVQIALLVRIAQLTPWNDVPQLQAACNSIVRGVFYAAKCMNLTHYGVVCEYKAYTIDGQQVWIDPLKVVNYDD